MKNDDNKKAVVLLSGGMDSSVVLAMAAEQGFRPYALTVDYGQRHSVELESAAAQAIAFGVVEHKVMKLDLTGFEGCALTSELPVPKDGPRDGAQAIPVTYVPARNTIFLSLALGYAESINARDIFIGVSSVDYSGYPDCRPEFVSAFEEVANRGTRAADDGSRFVIHAPLLSLTKGQTVEAGLALGVDFGKTRTCYDPAPGGAPCGQCDACRLRQKGFSDAKAHDPVLNLVDKKQGNDA